MGKKIIIVSRFENSGGAAIAAYRLYKALLLKGSNSVRYLFYDDNKDVFHYIKKKVWHFLEYGLFRFIDKNVLRSINAFGLISLKKNLKNPDTIVNLHWVHFGLLSIEQIARIKNPLIVTLHDSWFVNSSSHYNQDFNFYKLGSFKRFIIKRVNRWVINRKRNINNITYFVTPSVWLKSLVLKDPHFSKFRIEVIPNPLDTDIFKPKKEIRINHKLNVLTFLDSEVNYLKGGDLLIKFIEIVNGDIELSQKITFTIVGSKSFNSDKFNNVIDLGFIKSEEELVAIYQSSDICISFSRSENLPQFLTQAASCGLPLMGFDLEGMPEVIIENFNGYLISPFNLQAYKKQFESLVSSPSSILKFSKNSRQSALDKWDQSVVAKKYNKLFDSVI